MKNVVLISCKKIRDHSCIGCAKCFKAAQIGAGEFGEPVSIIALTECGDCPGLVMPRVGLLQTILGALDQKPDAIYFSTCVKVAKETAGCPMDVEALKTKIEAKTGIPVTIGTHPYV